MQKIPKKIEPPNQSTYCLATFYLSIPRNYVATRKSKECN